MTCYITCYFMTISGSLGQLGLTLAKAMRFVFLIFIHKINNFISFMGYFTIGLPRKIQLII